MGAGDIKSWRYLAWFCIGASVLATALGKSDVAFMGFFLASLVCEAAHDILTTLYKG